MFVSLIGQSIVLIGLSSDRNWFVALLVFAVFFLIAFCFFLPNYFGYLLQIRENRLILKDGALQEAGNLHLDTIQSIEIDTLGGEPMYIKFNLLDENSFSFLTRERTIEVYNRLIEHFPAWLK